MLEFSSSIGSSNGMKVLLIVVMVLSIGLMFFVGDFNTGYFNVNTIADINPSSHNSEGTDFYKTVEIPIAKEPSKHWESLLAGVLSEVADPANFVYLYRFYDEHNLSFAKTRVIGENAGNESAVITSLSLNVSSVGGDLTNTVNRLAWSRTWYRQNYLVKKTGYAGDFKELTTQINKIRHFANVTGLPLKAIRFHTYTSYCKMLNELGDPSKLPLPIVLTFKLNHLAGHLSDDVLGKTCIRRKGYKRDQHECPQAIILSKYLRRCRKSPSDIKHFISNKNILLFITNQHVAISSNKVMVLPSGIRPEIATEAWLFIKKKQSEVQSANFERPHMLAISNGVTLYQDKVTAWYSKKFGVSAILTYESVDEVIPSVNYPEYFELLSSSKFTICPPGLAGLDSFRVWEALMLGSIPVVEASPAGPGLERSFSLLPVLVVSDLLQLTKSHFDEAYKCFTKNTIRWRFDILKQQHWDSMILGTLKDSSTKKFIASHPAYNPYCNFFLYNKTKKWS